MAQWLNGSMEINRASYRDVVINFRKRDACGIVGRSETLRPAGLPVDSNRPNTLFIKFNFKPRFLHNL